MRLTIEQVLTTRAGITSILRGSVDAVMAYRLGRIHRKLTEEAKDFSEAQKTLFDKLSEDGAIPQERRAEFERQNRGLLEAEIDVDVKQIPFSELTAAIADEQHVIPGEAWVQIEPIVTGIPE